ncbi:uncharacterized protein LOC126831904 [Patella vulgata]|uniref:uncharacterized protein LOC126831904 n=1 Tax=Patella vulgata TaxID=6465 RepID=UPI00217F2503|nr:uncharacterized protein LOC126831904 [Patella vulgata]XP_055956705.1 uncharacterized protein LOC126831904 [Patella vulgata]
MAAVFSRIHGDNVDVSDDLKTASWTVNKHYGICVIDQTLIKGDSIELIIDGTGGGGHVLLGLTNFKDKDFKGCKDHGTKVGGKPGKVQRVMVKGDKDCFRLERRSECQVIQTLRGEETVIDIDRGDNYRLCADILFGQLTLAINDDPKSKKFSWNRKLYGQNVQIFKDYKMVSLIDTNPQCSLAIQNPLEEQQPIKIKLTPKDGAQWHYMKLFASQIPPLESRINKSTNFSFEDNAIFVPLIRIKNPKDQLIMWLNGNTITCKVGLGSASYIQMTVETNNPIYIYAEICRLVLTMDVSKDEKFTWPEDDDASTHYLNAEAEAIYDEIYDDIPLELVMRDKKEPVENEEQDPKDLLKTLEKKLKSVNSNRKDTSYKRDQIYKVVQKFDEELKMFDKQPSSKDRAPAPLPRPSDNTPLCSASSQYGSSSSCIYTKRGNDTYIRKKVPVKLTNDNVDELEQMIKDLKKRVAILEDKKKRISIRTSFNLN